VRTRTRPDRCRANFPEPLLGIFIAKSKRVRSTARVASATTKLSRNPLQNARHAAGRRVAEAPVLGRSFATRCPTLTPDTALRPGDLAVLEAPFLPLADICLTDVLDV
jgi:hypothetical protein